MSPDAVRAAYERIRAEVGPGVTVVAATKYVAPEDMAVLAEAGVEVVGENRAQDLQAKHAMYGDAFRWHFIGHLQSNKAKIVNGICELVHSLDSDSAAGRLTVPALVEVNLSGEASKSGVRARTSSPRSSSRLSGRPRADDDAAARPPMPRRRGRTSGACASSRTSTACRAVDGHDPGLPRRRRGGRDARPRRLRPLWAEIQPAADRGR